LRRIPVGSPKIYPIDFVRVGQALWKRELSGYSPQFLPKFENEFARIAGTRYSCAVNSGTSAIYLALAALNLRKGTKVAVSSYTNMATFFPVLQLGLVPVPIDIQTHDYNLDPDDLNRVINEKFGAIIVVHIFGIPAKMDAIMQIAERLSIPVIEDCAEAHGATYHGKLVGSFGKAGCFSFYANKIIGTGEGGAISTNDESFYKTITQMRSLAFGKANKFLHESDGYNFRMTNIQAALGLSQISKLKKVLSRKAKIAEVYRELLVDCAELILPDYSSDGSVTWMYHLRLKCGHEICRDKIIAEMGAKQIELRPGFIPFSDQTKIFRKYRIRVRQTPVASALAKATFYLPTSLDIKLRQQKKVCRELIKAVGGLHNNE
jgi:perosamine synthetase